MDYVQVRQDQATGLWVVEVYSPTTGGFIPQAEWRTKEEAEEDRRSWNKQRQDERRPRKHEITII